MVEITEEKIEKKTEAEIEKEIKIKKDRMFSLAEIIQIGMPTKYEQDRLNSIHRRNHMEWEKRNMKNIQEWKELRREFGLTSNVEILRKPGFRIEKGVISNVS